MSMFLLPKLLARKSRSAIISVSSRVAYKPAGMTPIYCATKAYNLMLSESMRDQFSNKIDFLSVTPATTKT